MKGGMLGVQNKTPTADNKSVSDRTGGTSPAGNSQDFG